MKQLVVISLVALLGACRGGGDDGSDADVEDGAAGSTGLVFFNACVGSQEECAGDDGEDVAISGSAQCEYVHDGHSYWAATGSISDGITGVEFTRLEVTNDPESPRSARSCESFTVIHGGIEYRTESCGIPGDGVCGVEVQIDEEERLTGRFMCTGIGDGLSTVFHGTPGHGTFEFDRCFQ